MRMRRKKNLDDRLAACGDVLRMPALPASRDFRTAGADIQYIDLDTWFGRSAPLWLEIGCGLGQFAVELARRHPEINILAVEKVSNVIVTAAEKAMAEHLPNVRFLCMAAEYLPLFLSPQTVGRLYLNFSCPYPKKRYADHRLTSKRFLPIYQSILTQDAEIHQKTDNRQLFEFSVENLTAFGWALKNVSLDLHHSDFEGNIMTEYESRFVAQGLPIYHLEAYRK